MFERLDNILDKYNELSKQLTNPEIISDYSLYNSIEKLNIITSENIK